MQDEFATCAETLSIHLNESLRHETPYTGYTNEISHPLDMLVRLKRLSLKTAMATYQVQAGCPNLRNLNPQLVRAESLNVGPLAIVREALIVNWSAISSTSTSITIGPGPDIQRDLILRKSYTFRSTYIGACPTPCALSVE